MEFPHTICENINSLKNSLLDITNEIFYEE